MYNIATQFAAPYFTALLLGITSGISQCSVFCAPFISTYVMGTGKGAAEGLKSFFVFSTGRVFMCAMLGLAAGYIGAAFTGMGKNLECGSIIYGAALILIGLLMLLRPVCVCRKSEDKNGGFAFLSKRFVFNPTTHLFIMGMALATIPCPPMGAHVALQSEDAVSNVEQYADVAFRHRDSSFSTYNYLYCGRLVF